jgi:isopentenyl-diphosphate Delta-isomerase
MSEQVILVDNDDRQTGTMEKMEAHEKGLLHRAFSVFVFNSRGELLMQQRAKGKYHSGGLWTNTCCSHPRNGDQTEAAALRRLNEEMGIVCKLNPAFHFIYKAEFDNGLTEHEYDYVFFGSSDNAPKINRSEVQDYKYISLHLLAEDIKTNPANYTAWLKDSFDMVVSHFGKIK